MIDGLTIIPAGVYLVVDDSVRVRMLNEPNSKPYMLGAPDTFNVNTFPTKQEALDYITLNNLEYENIY